MFNKRDKEKAAEIKEFPIAFGSHGLKLKGKIFLPKNSNADEPVPGAVLCHGFGAAYRVMEAGAQTMAAQGIATLIFDFRGHGTSEGTADGKMVEDVVDAWNFLSQLPEIDSKRMGLIDIEIKLIWFFQSGDFFKWRQIPAHRIGWFHKNKNVFIERMNMLDKEMEENQKCFYTVKYNPFMGVRSDWKDDSILA